MIALSSFLANWSTSCFDANLRTALGTGNIDFLSDASNVTSPSLVPWTIAVGVSHCGARGEPHLADSREAREALAAADGERAADRRRADLLRAEEALRARHVLVPLARVPLRLGPRAGVHGLRATAAGVLVMEDAWIEP